eukprot:CAMPEP_0172366562 /NCGR_PEP_ID=MMETSP1060-20121228/16141_1 /TAXON_ID=37318 /ORGANISM="Pseudo-nitzschia pungens, Strain cf. cingulata" /LENGTH=225 /DNA_ID=CAMNT_0013090485 /DNA_START=197 /DNA_END=871 /DNA_ORIENTATION=+
MISSTTRQRTIAKNLRLGPPQRNRSTFQNATAGRLARRPATNCTVARVHAGTTHRSLSSSSAPPSSKPPSSASSSAAKPSSEPKKTGSTEIVPNVVLASVLFGFVASVFTYSMNAVGRGDGDAADGGDPLAQLKAEAQEAREHRDSVDGGSGSGGGRMTPEEIAALESGLGASAEGEVDGDRIIRDVAVAAPADIAALEEEANLKVFRNKQKSEDEEPKKKKPWW